MSQDAKLFARGKVEELRAELQADKKDKGFAKRRITLKKVVASMTMGQDMSSLFPDVVACINIQVLEVKKMVYLYLINYSRSKPDMVQYAMEGFLSDCNDRNPLIRALAIRTMAYINVPQVLQALIDPLNQSLKDSDPYVRKTAAICVAKLFAHDKRLVERENFVNGLRDLLADSNPTVVANAVASLTEISERSDNIQLRLNMSIASKLVSAMSECSEWGQTYILEALMYFVPQEHADAEILAERIAIRLQHSNSAVVLTTIKVVLYLMNYMGSDEAVEAMCRKLSPPLVTLLSSGYEVQYVALRNILMIVQRRPTVLKNEVKVFFCKYNDPIYVKLAKLEIIFRLANEKNVEQVLAELAEYAAEVDVDFVRRAVRSIGRLAIKIQPAADRCIAVLLQLVQTKVNYVVQEAIVVIKDIFRRYPNQYERIIAVLCENLDALDTAEAKAAMIWIIGQYADRIENSEELLEDFLASFLDEAVEVQLALLTATVKLFIKRPTAGAELVPKVLKWATEEVDNPDLRDRGYIYWRLLSTDPGAAAAIVLSEKPPISTETEAMDRGLLDRLLLYTGSLASIYHQAPETFIRNAKPKRLHASSALHPDASRTFLDTLNLPAHVPPEHIETTDVRPLANGSGLDTSTSSSVAPPPPLPPKPLTPTSPTTPLPPRLSNDDPLTPAANDSLDPYASLGQFGGATSANGQYAFGMSSSMGDGGTDSPHPMLPQGGQADREMLY